MTLFLKTLFVAALGLGACSKTADTNTTTVVDPAAATNEAKADSMINGTGDASPPLPTEDAAERAGRKVDAATERAGDKMSAAADKAGDKLDAAANKAAAKTDAALQKTGRAIDRAKEAARQTAADAKANAQAAAAD